MEEHHGMMQRLRSWQRLNGKCTTAWKPQLDFQQASIPQYNERPVYTACSCCERCCMHACLQEIWRHPQACICKSAEQVELAAAQLICTQHAGP